MRMGKQRRERQKYHLSRRKSTNSAVATGTESCESNEKPLQETSILLPVPENLFAGINISVDNLKQSLKDSDSRSVISKKSLSPGNVISKKEKRKLRHEAFLKKLEAAYHVRKDAKKQRKLKTSPLKTEAQPQSDKFPLLNLSDKLPPLNLNIELAQKSSSSKKKPVIKQRNIPKAKRRNKGQLLAALIAACLVTFLTEVTSEETTTDNGQSSNSSWVNGANQTQNAYVISSVQFEIGVMQNETEGNGESGTTVAPVETDKLSETKVAFLLPPASLFNISQTTSAP